MKDESDKSHTEEKKQGHPVVINMREVKDATTRSRIMERVGLIPDINELSGLESAFDTSNLSASFNQETKRLSISSSCSRALSELKSYLNRRKVGYTQMNL